MRKSAFLLILLPLFITVSGQDLKKLDLETAVMQQYRELAPENLSGLEWISDDRFSHTGDDGTLFIRNLKGDTVQTIGVREVNKALSAIEVDSISSVRPYAWMGANELVLKCGNLLAIYNLTSKNAKTHLSFSEKGENLKFSKQSGFLAYTVGRDVYVATPADTAIRVTQHEGTATSAGIAIHRSEFGITEGLFWSADGLKLGFYEMDESMVTDYPLADYEPYPAEVNLIKYPMAGQKSHHAKVGIFDVKSKKTRYLKTGAPLDQYLTNFTFSPDGNTAYLAVVNRDQNKMALHSYATASGSMIKTLFTEENPKYIEPESPPIFTGMENGSFLWFSERDGFNHLYHYKADGSLIGQVTKGPFDVLEVNGYSKASQKLNITTTEGLMSEAVYEVYLQKGKMKKITSSPATYTVIMGDGSSFILRKQSLDTANDLKLYTDKGKQAITLLSPKSKLSGYALGTIELPVLKANDGSELQARMIKPFDFDASKKYPVLVYVYGGPHAQMVRNGSTAGAPLWMFEAANRGYIIFTVDGRGSAHRGLAFEQAVFRNLGTVEMEDQLTGVEYLESLPYVDASKMAVHGWSFGGFMTTSLMLRHPGVFKVGVAGGPVTDWRLYEVMYGERYMDTPEQNPEGYKANDLKNYADKLEGNLLLIHGLDDDVVVPQHSYTLIEAFVKAGEQVDFFTYPGHKHNVRGRDRVHLLTKVLDYVDAHLK